jgi:hypothetical protein
MLGRGARARICEFSSGVSEEKLRLEQGMCLFVPEL